MDEHSQSKQKMMLLQELIHVDLEAGMVAGTNNRRSSRVLKIWVIVVSALVTITLGWSFLGEAGKFIAIFFSAILTGLNTWDAFGDYGRRAELETANANKLYKLMKDIELYLQANESCEMKDYDEFKIKYDKIYEEYVAARNPENKNTEQSGAVSN